MITKLIHFLVLSGLTLCALPADAQISVVKTGALNNISDLPSYTLSFDASNGGNPVNKLIVSAGTESATLITGITYNGVALTLIPNTGTSSGRNRGIWYLDNPFSGGAADIVVSGDGVALFAHMRLGVASISGSAPGAAVGNIASATSVSLNVPVANSFVFAAYAGNDTSARVAQSPLVSIFATGTDSANMAAGYEYPVAAGPATYSFATASSPQTSAAAFVPAGAAPALAGVSPADNTTNVAIAANLVATFSNPVIADTGNIELRKTADNSLVESFDVASSPQLTFSGQTLTINPTSNLATGVEYYILIPATAVKDATTTVAFAGISDPTVWSFTTDGAAPTLASLNPVDGALGVRISSNLVATFSEAVLAGTGNVELWQDGGGSPLETFNVASSPQLAFSGATLTINPTADLTPGTGYHIRIAPTAIVDASNLAFAGISDPALWNFTADGTPPTLATLSPVDDAGLVSDSANLVATFSESVVAGTGNIQLWKAGGGSPVESFDVASSPQLSFSGATLTINPTASLDFSSAYHVIVPSTAVKDLSGNLFSGLTASTAWNFTTGNPPAALTFLNKESFSDTATKSSPAIYNTTTFDPDDTADALVLMLATEGSSLSATVSFGSQSMTQVIMNGTNPVGIYYLNNPSTSPQPVSVTITSGSGGSISGMGFTIFALNNSDNLGIVPTSVVNNFTSQTPLSIDIGVPDTGSFLVAGYNNASGSGSLSVNAPLTSLHAGDFGSLLGAFGYEENVAGGTKTYGFTTSSVLDSHYSAAVSFVGIAAPAGNFSSWISNSAFGLALADRDLRDDPDGDGNGNGVENFFGTDPGTFTQGLLVGIKSGNTFTFTHPKNASPASDLTASYSWSKDLASFLANGATDGVGTTVAFTTQANTPSPGITTVTATVTGTAASNLFVRVNVTQP